jgi:hypothetical protein
MNPSYTAATLCYLIRDTFRQALAQGIFAVLLVVSLLAIGVCLTLGVRGSDTMAQGDENPDFLSRRDPESKESEKLKTSGVTVAEGDLTVAFGAIDVPLARDTRSAVHFVELVLAGGVADTLGLMLTLIWTAGFLPGFLEARNISVLLAKPAPRCALLLGKYIGVLSFVLFNAIVFVGGTWLAIGARTGFWEPAYLLCIPLLLLHFSIFFGFSVLLAVATQNAVVCVFGSLLFWCVAWSMNFGRHALVTSTDLVADAMQSSFLKRLVDFGYWVLPKPADLGMLLFDALGASNHFGPLLDPQALAPHGFSIALSVASSLGFAAIVMWISARKFQAADY